MGRIEGVGMAIKPFEYFDNALVLIKGTFRSIVDTILSSRIQRTVTSTNVNYTQELTDETILVDATNSEITITLLSAQFRSGKLYDIDIKKIDASVNPVTIQPPTGQTIDSLSSIQLLSESEIFTLRSDGTNYYII